MTRYLRRLYIRWSLRRSRVTPWWVTYPSGTDNWLRLSKGIAAAVAVEHAEKLPSGRVELRLSDTRPQEAQK